MDRKRSLESAGGAAAPPAKHIRLPEEEAVDTHDAPIVMFQRAQLAAKVADQERELDWARNRIEQLQYAVGALDAAPMSSNYYMAECIEELGLALLRAGLPKQVTDDDPAVDSCPIAAALLDAELVSNEKLKEHPRTLKRLTAHLVVELERRRDLQRERAEDDRGDDDIDARDEDANDAAASDRRRRILEELHVRMRAVSDQLERYADRDKQNTVESTTLRDELDDLRALLDIRRRRIIALELSLRQLRKQSPEEAIAGAVVSAVCQEDPAGAPASQNGIRMDGEVPPGSDGTDVPVPGKNHVTSEQNPGDRAVRQVSFGDEARGNGNRAAPGSASEHEDAAQQPDERGKVAATRHLADSRLRELTEALEEKKALILKVNSLSNELALREKDVLSYKDVVESAVYQTMEASLQQLYLKERTWETEREAAMEEWAEEKRDAQELFEETSAAALKEIDELRKHVDELRRVAESAKSEKDKWVMTYEARKLEASSADTLLAAADRRAVLSEEMRDKLKAAHGSILLENADLRRRVEESELRAIQSAGLPDGAQLVSRLERDLRNQEAKCTSFIQEVESLSVMFGDLEAENARLVKLLTEKESVLSKVMSEKLKGRQQLATVKEEARALAQGRDLDHEKIKHLSGQVSASKRAATEATLAVSKASEEVRALSQQLVEQRKIAEDAIVSLRIAQNEKEALRRERDVALARVDEIGISEHSEKFELARVQEENERLTRELAKAKIEQAQLRGPQNELDRDDIIQVLMKKLNCSVLPDQPKEVALTRCGHMMSRKCVSQLITGRSRKCPLCGTMFAESEILNVYLD